MQTNPTARRQPARPPYLCLSVPSQPPPVHTKTHFVLFYLQVLQKQHIKGSFFSFSHMQSEAAPLLVSSPPLPVLFLCDGDLVEGASISEDPPHPYQWRTLYLMWFGNVHSSCPGECERSKDWKPEVGNRLSLNGTTSPGEGKHCARWGTEWLRGEVERRAHMLGLCQRILNSCINYSGKIAWKIIDGHVLLLIAKRFSASGDGSAAKALFSQKV